MGTESSESESPIEATPTGEPGHPAAYVFGPFRLDLISYQLTRSGTVVPLQSKSFDTLRALLVHRNRVVSKDELLALVWPKSFVSEDSLAHNIFLLRRALGDDSNSPNFIATIPRRGYRFVAAVEEIPSSSSLPTPPPPSMNPPEAISDDGSDQWTNRPATSKRHPARLYVVAAAAILIAASLGIGIDWEANGRATLPDPITFTVAAPSGTQLVAGAALSPDGSRLAFTAQDLQSRVTHLWISDLRSGTLRRLPGTEGANQPFWAPDGQNVGFVANYTLKRIAFDDLPPRTLARGGVALSGGASWGRNEQIVFSRSGVGLLLVSANGGEPTPITTLVQTAAESDHRHPQFLPDGDRFLYTVVSPDPARAGTYVGTVSGDTPRRILEFEATYAPPDHLLYVHDGLLMAQQIDTERMELVGTASTVVGNVSSSTQVSASGVDRLVFSEPTVSGRLTWVSRNGQILNALDLPAPPLRNIVLGADGRYLVGEASDNGRRSVWLVDLDRGSATKLTDGRWPLLSPDSATVIYTSDGMGASIHSRPISGISKPQTLLQTSDANTLTSWSRDRRHLVYVRRHTQARLDVWLLAEGESKPRPLLTGAFNELQAQISPDGRWIAYVSDESGSWEVHVESFPSGGSKRAVSIAGGAQPQWRSDGKELFYMAPDNTLMAAAVNASLVWDHGRPTPLFRAPVSGGIVGDDIRTRYVPSPDGTRFLIDAIDDRGKVSSMTVVVNWKSALK